MGHAPPCSDCKMDRIDPCPSPVPEPVPLGRLSWPERLSMCCPLRDAWCKRGELVGRAHTLRRGGGSQHALWASSGPEVFCTARCCHCVCMVRGCFDPQGHVPDVSCSVCSARSKDAMLDAVLASELRVCPLRRLAQSPDPQGQHWQQRHQARDRWTIAEHTHWATSSKAPWLPITRLMSQ